MGTFEKILKSKQFMKQGLIIMFLMVYSMTLIGRDLSFNLDSLAKEQVKSRFMQRGNPERYYSNILILLKGSPTKDDSLIIKEMIDTLHALVEKWEVALIPRETSNLVVEINSNPGNVIENSVLQNSDSYQIIKSSVSLNLDRNLDFNHRKKQIYYHLLRSLVVNHRENNANPIPGSVFTESQAENITFHPVDFRIIKEIYSEKYEERSRDNQYMKRLLSKSLMIKLFAISFSLLFLFLIAQRGLYRRANKLSTYLLQGSSIMIAYFIYLIMETLITNFIFGQFPKDWINSFFARIVLMFLGGIGVLILLFFIEHVLVRRNSSLAVEISVPLITTTVFAFLFLVVLLYWPGDSVWGSFWLQPTMSFCFLSIVGRSIFIYLSRKSENLIRQKDLQLAQLNELHKQAELQSLRAKINPHFLYNSLNSIAGLAHTDADKTEQMALALSDFFKYSINREQRQANSLADELNAIRTYLDIEKVRFGDRLNFEIYCPEECLEIQIPQLLIQPLVENAIKHGLSQMIGDGLIRIAVSHENSLLKIRVYDNGPAFPDGPLTGFGLRNTQERIAMLFGSKASVNWENGAQKYVEVSLPFMALAVKKD